MALEMALKRRLNPEKGRVRRSEEGPVSDSPRIKPMPFERSISPGLPLSVSLETSEQSKRDSI